MEIDILGGTPATAADIERDAAVLGESARPSLFRADSDFYENAGISRLSPRIAWAALKDTFGSRQGAAESIADAYNDDHGLSSLITGGAQVVGTKAEPMVRLPDGTVYRLNDPGLDTTDVARFASNVGAFFTPAAWAQRLNQAKNFGLAARAAVQAGAAGATDAALQLGFDAGNVDPFRTLSSAAGGAAGEAIGTGVGAFAQRAIRAFRDHGASRAIDPVAAQSAIQSADELAAGANPAALMGRDRYGFQYTQGQRTLDPKAQIPLLNREEALRQSPGAQEMFDAAARRNQEQLVTATGDIAERLGGQASATPAELAGQAATRVREQAGTLKSQINDAYDTARESSRAAVGVDYVGTLPDRLRRAVVDFDIDPAITPVANQTLNRIRNVAGSFGDSAGSGVKGVTLKAIEAQRKIINTSIDATTSNTDRSAMLSIKREFDQWVDDAVENALISGDTGAIAALKDARRLRAEYGRRFEGGEDTDRFIASLLDGSRTPEELINTALGASGVSKAGGARFIERLRQAADGDEEVIGALRSAHFLRMALGKDGSPQKMGDIIRNIRSTEYGNESVVDALYSPEEWAEIESLASALGPLVPKGDFARSSGTTERLFRMILQRIGGIPLAGPTVQSVDNIVSAVRANTALNKPLRLRAQAPEGSQALGASSASDVVR